MAINLHIKLTIILTVFTFINTQQSSSSSTILSLESAVILTLPPAQQRILSLQLPSKRGPEDCLFIYAAPTVADPFQVPLLTITAQDYQLRCFNAEAEFAGLCRVSAEDLALHPKLSVTVQCLVECQLEVQAYLGATVRMEVGDSLDLTAGGGQQQQLAELIHIDVPKDDYTLAVMAVILNPQQSIAEGEEGVELLANFGEKVQDPSQQKFQYKGSSLNGGGKGLFLYRNQVPQGELKCLLRVKAGISVRFSVTPLRGNNFGLTLGHSYYDYALPDEQKQYSMDLSGYLSSDKTIEVVFDVYSGRPKFQLSFQLNFSTLIEFPQVSSANSLLLSPSIRSRYKFKDFLYIRVGGHQTSQYYLYTQLVRDDVAYLQPYLAYFDQLDHDTLQNYILMERYKFKEESKWEIKNFTFKVEVASGDGSFHFKRCKQLEGKAQDKPSLADCLITSPEQLKTQQFYSQEIQPREAASGNLRSIFMEYNVAECTRQKEEKGWVHVLCAFHVIARGDSSLPFSFSLLPQRRYLTSYLREGKILKEYIPRDHYAYFVLSLNDLPKVEEANIFLTALSGDAALIVSSEQELPTLSSPATLRQSGSKCNLILTKDRLSKEIYISVFAYQFTEINLGVVVRRKGDGSALIPLQEGNPQTYLLNKTQPTAKFKITAREQKQIIVMMNQISGHVAMEVTEGDGRYVQCKNGQKDRLQCTFIPYQGGEYTVKVEAAAGLPDAKFTIAFKSELSDCLAAALNQPIYLTLSSKSSSCYRFSLNRVIDLQFSLSLTHLQAIQNTISASFSLNDQPPTPFTSPHKSITVADLIEVCPIGLQTDSFVRSCNILINLENKGSQESEVSLILEETDADIALFDGVGERVHGAVGDAGEGKRFYYHTASTRPIQIFFSTQSLRSQYFLAARFVPPSAFLTRLTPGTAISLYPAYFSPQQRSTQKTENRHNYYTAVLGSIGLETLTIDSKQIKDYCSQLDCYLLLSVFKEEYEGSVSSDQDYYVLEVTQQETVLALGETKFGTIDKDELYTYVVQPNNAIVQFTLRNGQGKKKACLQAQAATGDGKVIKKSEVGLGIQVSKKDGVERVFVKGLEDGCAFDVSYLSNDVPYRIVRLSHPYQLDLTAQESARFIYYHQNPRSFKLVNLISTGTSKAYILPLKNNKTFTLTSLSQLKPSDFPLVSTFDGEITLKDNDANFCSRCYYYIMVSSDVRFVGQVVFLRLYDPIPLSTSHVLKQHLSPNIGLNQESYIFYALASFNLTFNLLSGSISITLQDPTGAFILNESKIDTKTSFPIKTLPAPQKQRIELYSEHAKYRIQVSVLQQAQFYVEITRRYTTERLFEGFPSLVELSSSQTQTVEFISSEAGGEEPLSLMVDVDEGDSEGADVLLTFALQGETEKGMVDNEKLLKSITKADNTYIISLLNIEGRYFVDIRSNTPAKATFLLIRSSLTHLSPTNNYLFTSPGVYQIFSNRKKVMLEVFNCQGEPSIIGSTDLESIQDDNFKNDPDASTPVSLKRPNYGGHYVYATDALLPSYFLRISNKIPKEPFEYLINYYYYDDVNPYEAIDAPTYDITAEITNQGQLKLTVAAPQLMNYGKNSNVKAQIKMEEVKYSAFVAEKKVDLNRYSRCRIDGQVIQTKDNSSPSLIIDLSKTNKTTNTLYATVEATIKISILQQNKSIFPNSPTEVTLLYNTIQISPGSITVVQQSYTYWFTNNLGLFIGWMLLPFVLAAASLYYLLVCCLRRIMLRQQSMVEEVEIVPSNQTVPTEQKLAPESGHVQPDTGTQIIKESI